MASINSRNGNLYVDFRYIGQRCREQTLLADTKPNRKRLENFVSKMEAEIQLGSFKYENYFPQSKKIEKFKSLELMRSTNSHKDSNSSFDSFSKVWIVLWNKTVVLCLKRELDFEFIGINFLWLNIHLESNVI